MKIAILGAGFCGMASAAYFTTWIDQGFPLEISLFDPGDLGDNASGIAAGLLHAYPGASAKLAYRGQEALKETLALAHRAGAECLQKTGMLRLALTEKQRADFDTCAKKNNDVRRYEAGQIQKLCPPLACRPGIYLENAYRVETVNYLKGLWKLCCEKGVLWHKEKISSLKVLEDYDVCIVAIGAKTASLPELAHIPIRPMKGQILTLQWPEDLHRFSFPINSRAYLIPNGGRCLAGATFEREFHSETADMESAIAHLKPRIQELVPEMTTLEVLDCRSGLRAATPDRLPLVRRVSEKAWVITGMGSKGLLFHALLAKELVRDVIRSFYNKILGV